MIHFSGVMWIASDEMGKWIWMEMVVAYFETLTQYLFQANEENLKNIITRRDYRRALDWRLNLFSTLTYKSWLQVIITPSLHSTIYKSPEHRLVFSVCYSLH
jgi:hypothetical protein